MTSEIKATDAHVKEHSSQDMSILADMVRARGVKRIAYFHCDHFEPWRPVPGAPRFDDNAREVEAFAKASARNEFARRLTLFYKAHVPVGRTEANTVTRVTPDDPIGFFDRTKEHVESGANAMRGLLSTVDHEIQLHLHHEHFTSNSGHRNPQLIEDFARPEVQKNDSARVEMALERSIAAIREDTGLSLDRWFFVHGVWALNGSDDTACRVNDEIKMLMRHGCLGDFTFPAGRRNVDPIHKEPFFVRPIVAPRLYDLPEAEPERAWGNARAAADNKFFIWASIISHLGSSVDYYAEWLRKKLEYPMLYAAEVLQESFVTPDGTLWFKTHGHSMHAQYVAEGETTIYPHEFPPIKRALGMIFDAGSAAGADIAFPAVSEVYDAFLAAEVPADVDPSLKSAFDPVAASSSTDIVDKAALLNAAAGPIILDFMEELGEKTPGVGAYYAVRAEKNGLLAPYEIRIAESLLAEPGLTSVVEVGSGLSMLPMFLSMLGKPSIGIERDSARVDVGRRLRDRLVAETDIDLSLCELRGEAAPAALRDIDGKGKAIIFTNISASVTQSDVDEIIQLARGFSFIFADLSRFFVARDADERAELLRALLAAGWRNAVPLSGRWAANYWVFNGGLDAADDQDEWEREEA